MGEEVRKPVRAMHTECSELPGAGRSDGRPRGPYLALLRENPSFRRLWFAQLISLGGDWFNLVALTGLLLQLTGSSFYAGAVLAASLVPQFLTSPLAGVISDRFDRKRLMLGANLVAAVLALAMLAVRSPQTVWLGLAALAGIAVTGAFFDPASRAGLPNIVREDQLAAANVLMASTWGVMVAVGAAAGGIVAGLAGRDAAFIANAASFLISAGLILGVRGRLGPTGVGRRELHPLLPPQFEDGLEPERAIQMHVQVRLR